MKIFEGLGHVAFKVNDLEKSLAFYNTIGFPEILRLLDEKGKPWIVYIRIKDMLLLELFPGGTGKPVPGPEATGLFHFCLTVADIDAAEAALKSAGVPLTHPRNPKCGVDGNRGMWIEDPDGHRIEIMEMAPDCIQFKALETIDKGGKATTLSTH